MGKNFRKIVSLVLSILMIASMGIVGASAATINVVASEDMLDGTETLYFQFPKELWADSINATNYAKTDVRCYLYSTVEGAGDFGGSNLWGSKKGKCTYNADLDLWSYTLSKAGANVAGPWDMVIFYVNNGPQTEGLAFTKANCDNPSDYVLLTGDKVVNDVDSEKSNWVSKWASQGDVIDTDTADVPSDTDDTDVVDTDDTDVVDTDDTDVVDTDDTDVVDTDTADVPTDTDDTDVVDTDTADEPDTPDTAVYSVVGAFNGWNIADEATEMTFNAETGLYEFTTTLAAGSYEYKVATDHSWDNPAYGVGEGNALVSVSAEGEVKFTFNPETKEVNAEGEYVYVITEHTYRVAGSADLCGSGWDPADDANLMTLNEETGLYEKTYLYEGSADESLELKVTKDGATWYGVDGGEANLVVTFADGGLYEIVVTFNAETNIPEVKYTSIQLIASDTDTDDESDIDTDTDVDPTPVKILMGDVNCDGKITISDAVNIQKHALKIIELKGNELLAADIFGLNRITLADAIEVLKYAVGAPTTASAPYPVGSYRVIGDDDTDTDTSDVPTDTDTTDTDTADVPTDTDDTDTADVPTDTDDTDTADVPTDTDVVDTDTADEPATPDVADKYEVTLTVVREADTEVAKLNARSSAATVTLTFTAVYDAKTGAFIATDYVPQAGDVVTVTVTNVTDSAVVDEYTFTVAVADFTFGVVLTVEDDTVASAIKVIETTVETPDVYSVVGAFQGWAVADETTTLVYNPETGLYEFTTTLAAGSYEYKVVTNYSWDNPAYGVGEGNALVSVSAEGEVTFTFNPVTGEVNAIGEYVYVITENVYRVAGSADLCGSGWDPADDANLMTLNEETGLYEKVYVYEGAEGEVLELKVTKNGATWYGVDGGDANLTIAFDADGEYTIVVTFDEATGIPTVTATLNGGVDTDTETPDTPDEATDTDAVDTPDTPDVPTDTDVVDTDTPDVPTDTDVTDTDVVDTDTPDVPTDTDVTGTDVYSVAGAFQGWDQTDATTEMTLNADTGLYEFTTTLAAGSYEYKIVMNHSWDTAFGVDGGNALVSVSAEGEVKFTFNPETQEVNAEGEYVYVITEHTYRVAGSADLCGSGWNPADDANIMTLNDATGLYEKTYSYTAEAEGENVEFKVTQDGATWYGVDGGEGNCVITFDTVGDYTVVITFDATTNTPAYTVTPVVA